MASPYVIPSSTYTSTDHTDTYPAIAQANHQGQTVMISGASKGIGRSTAISFARSGASNIIIAARSGLDEVEQEMLAAAPSSHSPPQIIKLQLDVTSEDSVAHALERVKQTCGHLDILVNNAGYLERWLPVAETDPGEWWRTWEVNVKGVYLVTRAFLPLLLQSSQKTIINVSSIGAHMTVYGASSYQTTKLAVLRFTEFLAVEYGDQGLIAIAVHPGSVKTELAENLPNEVHQYLVDTPELAADSIAWLTQHRHEWLSGRYVSVNWDLPELMAKKDEIVKGDKLKVRIVL